MEEEKLLEQVVAIARKAGDKIMEIYESRDFGVETKSDESPLTKADLAANEKITTELQKISDLDIVSEEGKHGTANDKFWLVDPLDGTKEFIKRNGEFTVNIALIEQSKPILGVVYAPAKGLMYFGAEQAGAFKIENNKKVQIKSIYRGEVPTLVVSRSHRDERINELLKIVGDHKEISMGSSLKLCLVAEGKAKLYPRLAPTCLWDTAAADAIVRIAGGKMVDLEGKPLTYEPQNNIKNPFFITVTQNTKDLEKYLKHLS